MTRRNKIWLFAGLGYLLWLILSWLLGNLLELSGSSLWVLRLGMALLGLGAAAVLVWYFLRELRDKEGAPPPTVRDEIDVAVATAKSRLAAARQTEKKRLSQMPLVLCLGPVGSAKTTTLVRSGLDPDLLAGEVFRGEAVVATRIVNLWYSNRTVFLEAGGRLVQDAGRWSRLVKHLQPSRLAAVFSTGRQAPRAALVCLSAEDLVKPGGGEQVMVHAKELRSRLLEVSHRLGIRLPVYVVFTKADRIPYFADFVRNLSNEEAREVLGVTLPWDSGPAGTYADRTASRINTAMQRLYGSLASHRLKYLPRETQATIAAGVYEFPREFRKLMPLATQFLVDLCRPSQLEVSPILRGFYFTGVRAIIVEEGAQAAPARPERQAESLRMDATQAFVPAFAGLPQAQPAAGAVSRKVPQWVFLTRLFRDVLLKDRVALAATAGGARVNLLRRLLLVTAAALAVIFTLGFVVSFVTNRKLQHRAENAARDVVGASLPRGDLASLETLLRLDSLRLQTAQLGEWYRGHPPLHLRWGLYSGNAMYRELRAIYFQRFDSLMFASTAQTVANDLLSLPDAPTDSSDYGSAYKLLKAHLVMTDFPDKSTPEFLAPVLTGVWAAGREVSDQRLRLAQDQFAFYAAELPRGNPLPLAVDSTAMAHARTYLQQFKGGEQIYQIMQAEAAKAPGVKAFDFNRAYPKAAGVVTSGHVVPGQFTRQGWEFMQDSAFKNTDRFFQGEEWVLGGERMSDRERRDVTNWVKTQYRNDYIHEWQQVLAQAHVAPLGGLSDAAKKLTALGGNPSPLLLLINAVSRNTAVDSQFRVNDFQPALMTSPPDSTKLIGEKIQPYMTAVLALGTALQGVATAPSGQSEGPVQDARSQASQAWTAAQTATLAFNPNSVNDNIKRLLLEPLGRIDPLLGNVGVAGLNKQGRDYCRVFQSLYARAPFRPGASSEASLADVTSQFQTGTGGLWTFYNDVLQRYLVQQGSRYGPKPGLDISLDPGFVEFFNRAAAFSHTLYPQGATAPVIRFTFRPLLSNVVTGVSLTIDGHTGTFTRTSTAAQPFQWLGTEAREARLLVQVGGSTFTLSEKGTWAVFRLFQQAQDWKTQGIVQRAQWSTRHEGQEVALPFELNLGGQPQIFDPSYFSRAGCTGRIAR